MGIEQNRIYGENGVEIKWRWAYLTTPGQGARGGGGMVCTCGRTCAGISPQFHDGKHALKAIKLLSRMCSCRRSAGGEVMKRVFLSL